MHAWVLDKAKPLGQILLEQEALSGERHALLEALVQEHLEAARQRRRSRAWPRSARSARSARTASRSPIPTCRPAWPSVAAAVPADGSLDATARLGGHADLRRPAVPHPAAARQGRAGPGLRRPRRGAAPRGRPQGDPGPPRRRPRQPGRGSCWRRRSPAAWSTPASCRSTAWATTPTAAPSTPCASSAATASRTPSSGSTAPTGRNRRPRRADTGASQAAGAVHRRLQRHRVRPQPRHLATPEGRAKEPVSVMIAEAIADHDVDDFGISEAGKKDGCHVSPNHGHHRKCG